MKKAAKKPTHRKRKQHASIEAHLHHLDCELEKIIMTAQDLQTAVDNLTAAVAKVSAEVAALKAAEPLITQEQLDANTQAVTDAGTALNAL